MGKKPLLPVVATAFGATPAPLSARAAEALAEPYVWGPHMMWGMGWYGMILGPLVTLLALAVFIAALVLVVRWLGRPWQGAGPPRSRPPDRTALDILKERFARGEIDKDEFEDRRRALGE